MFQKFPFCSMDSTFGHWLVRFGYHISVVVVLNRVVYAVGTILYFPMDEVTDSLLQGDVNAQLFNNPLSVDDSIRGKALQFDGASMYASFGNQR